MAIKQKNVWEPALKSDGLRILVTRIRGRGLPGKRYHAWMPNLGPSEGLLRQFQADKMTWAEFGRRYRKELFEGGSIDHRNRLIKNHGQKFTLRLLQSLAKRGSVTLMCHCAPDQPNCHRHVLREMLCRKI